jgi:hypothetical protein
LSPAVFLYKPENSEGSFLISPNVLFCAYLSVLKKVFAILLLSLLFFNWYGYRLLSAYLQAASDSSLEAKLDKQEYDESQLIELRIPINLPYHNDWTGFERFSGEVEIDGVHYKYVKRKVERGELVLMCLPNNEKQQLQTARDNFFKLVNDLQQNDSGKKSDNNSANVFKGLFSEYQQEKNNWAVDKLAELQTNYQTPEFLLITERFSDSPEQPPDTI